jgi:hypothetical protein
VVTFKGSVEADLTGANMPKTFESVLDLAAQNTAIKVRLLASTQAKLDGDILTYFDSGISAEEAAAHNALVEVAQQNREAVIDFVARVVGLDDIE